MIQKNNKTNKIDQVRSKYQSFFFVNTFATASRHWLSRGTCLSPLALKADRSHTLPLSLISPPGIISSSALIPSGIRISISRYSALRSMNNAIRRDNQIPFHHKPKEFLTRFLPEDFIGNFDMAANTAGPPKWCFLVFLAIVKIYHFDSLRIWSLKTQSWPLTSPRAAFPHLAAGGCRDGRRWLGSGTAAPETGGNISIGYML